MFKSVISLKRTHVIQLILSFSIRIKKLNESQSYLIVPFFRREHFRINSVVKWSIQVCCCSDVMLPWTRPGYHQIPSHHACLSVHGLFNSMIKWSIQVLVAETWCYRELGQGTIRSPHIIPVFQLNSFNNKIPNIPFMFVGFSRSF